MSIACKDKIFNVTGGKGGNSFLIAGDNKTALVDCGMAYCADDLISNIKHILTKKELDYVFASHSHYDHIGAVPYLKEEWPNLKICGTEYDKEILNRPTALNAIKELSMQAANAYQGNFQDYDNTMMEIDTVIADGDIIDLGDISVQVIETPGHTKHTLSFLVNHEILFASESTGYMSKSGKIYPAFLTSYSDTMSSISKCQEINPKFIIAPHFGPVDESHTLTYWRDCMLSARRSRDFMLNLLNLGYGEDEILVEYEKTFQDEESRLEQPINAFRINTQSMIKVVLREK